MWISVFRTREETLMRCQTDDMIHLLGLDLLIKEVIRPPESPSAEKSPTKIFTLN